MASSLRTKCSCPDCAPGGPRSVKTTRGRRAGCQRDDLADPGTAAVGVGRHGRGEAVVVAAAGDPVERVDAEQLGRRRATRDPAAGSADVSSIRTPDAIATCPRSATSPSEMSIIAVARSRPASTSAAAYAALRPAVRIGQRMIGVAGPSSASPAAARPGQPASTTRSPGRAPARVTGARPSRSPSAVTAIVTVSLAHDVAADHHAPTSAHSSRRPSASASSQLQRPGRAGPARPTRSAVGRAPIATTSARFCAAALRPTSYPSTSHAGSAGPRPAGPWWRPPGRPAPATTAASSPGPSSTPRASASRPAIRAISAELALVASPR